MKEIIDENIITKSTNGFEKITRIVVLCALFASAYSFMQRHYYTIFKWNKPTIRAGKLTNYNGEKSII